METYFFISAIRNESYEQIAENVKKTNFLEWTITRHSIPNNLKVLNHSDSSTFNAIPSFKIHDGVFDIAKKKSKDYYPFLIKKKACLPNYAQKLKLDFNISNDDLRKAFLLPHSVAFEPSKPFNLKYSILYFVPTQSCSGQTTRTLFAKGNLILIGKIYLWSCIRNEVLPTINSFIVRVNSKYEIEKYICTKNKSLQKLIDKWTL